MAGIDQQFLREFSNDLNRNFEKTFPRKFSTVIQSEGLVSEDFKGQQNKLLGHVESNTKILSKAIPLTLGQRFGDFFKNF